MRGRTRELFSRLSNPHDIYQGVTNPRKAIEYLYRQFTRSEYEFVGTVVSSRDYERHVEQARTKGYWEQLQTQLDEEFAQVDGTSSRGYEYVPGTVSRRQAFALYGLLRCLEPETVVETGVCNGMTTAFVLAALHDNDSGRLISIDYPEVAETHDEMFEQLHKPGGAVIPPGKNSGWIVPDRFRDRWNLRIGLSQDLLPEVVQEVGEMDVFIHDSEHVYDTMWFEFATAWPHINHDGVLLSDDTSFSKAFDDFVREHNRQRYTVTGDMALVQK